MILGLLLIFGAIFTLLAALGLNTMPDIYTKMHAVSKAGAFGGSVILLVAGISLGAAVLPIVVATIIFFYFTTPVAAQIIARAAIKNKSPFWEKTQTDELDFKD